MQSVVLLLYLLTAVAAAEKRSNQDARSETEQQTSQQLQLESFLTKERPEKQTKSTRLTRLNYCGYKQTNPRSAWRKTTWRKLRGETALRPRTLRDLAFNGHRDQIRSRCAPSSPGTERQHSNKTGSRTKSTQNKSTLLNVPNVTSMIMSFC